MNGCIGELAVGPGVVDIEGLPGSTGGNKPTHEVAFESCTSSDILIGPLYLHGDYRVCCFWLCWSASCCNCAGYCTHRDVVSSAAHAMYAVVLVVWADRLWALRVSGNHCIVSRRRQSVLSNLCLKTCI